MFTAPRTSLRTSLRRRTLAAAGTTVALALALSGCGGAASSGSSGSAGSPGSSASPGSSEASGTHHGTTPSATGPAHHSSSAMPGMDHAAGGDGLSSAQDGYRLTSPDRTLSGGRRVGYRFTVLGPDGKPVTAFSVEQTKRMHFYAIRSDLTGYQHLHPAMADNGTWTADLASLSPGSWRLFASFTPGSGAGKGHDLVLSRTVTVPGSPAVTPLPKAATSTTVDGYTVTVTGELMAGMAHPLTVTLSKGGKPVTDLQPYLGTYGHLTAFHEKDQALAHLHPEGEVNGDRGGPALSFHAELPQSGNWRLFLQFQTAGKLHTAALTRHVG